MVWYGYKTRSPFDELWKLQGDFARLMSSMGTTQTPAPHPPVNAYDDGEVFHLRVEVPGLDRSSIDVNVAGDVLTLKGQRAEEQVNGSYHRRERGWDAFDRSFTLPDAVDVDNVTASYNHGVLAVTLPRAPQSRPKTIAVEG